MQSKQFGKNLFWVVFSRLLSLLSNVAVGLLLPKIFSVTDYGYYKIFTLYATYTALLHFGFVDGLLLKLAGKSYFDLDHAKMRTYTRFFIVFQLIVTLIMALIGVALAKDEYLFIVIMLAINMLFVNITTYYQFVSQATQRFGDYSAKSLIASLVKLTFVGILFAVCFLNFGEISYKVYLLGLNLLDFSMAIWYIIVYREITFGKKLPISSLKNDIFNIFKTGIILTVAYQVSHLVHALDRQFVSVLFCVELFAVYSFAYNIVSMISTMISSLSVVLLPLLKQRSRRYVVESYKKSITLISIITAGTLFSYFPLVPFIEWFLPQYSSALEYIAIVLPAFLFISGITVVMFTIDKVLDMSFSFFVSSCIALVLGLVTNIVAYIIFRSAQAISYASLLVMAIWFLIEGVKLGRKIHVWVHKEFIYLVMISVSFLAVAGFTDNLFLGVLIFGIIFVALTIIFFFQFLRKSVYKIKKRRRKK